MSDIAKSLIARRLRHLSLLPEGEYCNDVVTIQMYLSAFFVIQGKTKVKDDGSVIIEGDLTYQPPMDSVKFTRIPIRFAKVTGACRITEDLHLVDIRGIESIGKKLDANHSHNLKWLVPAPEVYCTSLDHLTSQNLIALLNAKTMMWYSSFDTYGKTIAKAINTYHTHQDTLTLLTDLAEYPNLIRGLLSYDPVGAAPQIDHLDMTV